MDQGIIWRLHAQQLFNYVQCARISCSKTELLSIDFLEPVASMVVRNMAQV